MFSFSQAWESRGQLLRWRTWTRIWRNYLSKIQDPSVIPRALGSTRFFLLVSQNRGRLYLLIMDSIKLPSWKVIFNFMLYFLCPFLSFKIFKFLSYALYVFLLFSEILAHYSDDYVPSARHIVSHPLRPGEIDHLDGH